MARAIRLALEAPHVAGAVFNLSEWHSASVQQWALDIRAVAGFEADPLAREYARRGPACLAEAVER
jgi:nucleoside-diphosphate-sugar epimerase